RGRNETAGCYPTTSRPIAVVHVAPSSATCPAASPLSRPQREGRKHMRRRWAILGLLLAAVVAGGAVAVRSATQGSPGGPMAVVGFGPYGVLVDARSRRVFTLDDVGVDRRGSYLRTGAVSVLDAGTGAVLRSVPVGNNPTWMAGDERTRKSDRGVNPPRTIRGGVF